MNISILGCGWLGMPLAKELATKGHIIKGSTTGREKIANLSTEGIIPYQIKLLEEGIQGDIEAFLNDAEVLIINIPPGLRQDPAGNFIAKMGRLKDQIDRSHLGHIILVSSTSVFDDREDFPVYTEDVVPNSNQLISKQLIAVEELMISKDFKTSIIRFGGLYGPGRHPVNYLAGRKDINDRKAPVNLIHRDDSIGLIVSIIESGSPGIFHGVNPDHPTKEEYYKEIAQKLHMALPEFDHFKASKGKIISSIRVGQELGYAFSKSLKD